MHNNFMTVSRLFVLVGLGMGVIASYAEALAPTLFQEITQSSEDASGLHSAVLAVDDNPTTFSLTDNLPGSYWQAELGRPFELDQIEVVNRPSPNDAEMAGLTLSLFNIDDQVVFEALLSNPGAGARA